METREDIPAVVERACPECGRAVGLERFCTSCGHKFDDLVDAQGSEARTATLPALERTAVLAPVPAVLAAAPVAQGRHSRRAPVILAVALALAFAGLAVVAALWQQERSAHRSDQKHAAASIAALDSKIAGLQQQLRRAESLSTRQEAVLTQTASVLATVDPLLSRADKLQQLTGTIQGDRDVFSTSASQLVDDMITLGNDLLSAANDYGIDISYLNGEIDNVNGEINSVRYQASALSSSDSRYNDASQAFGHTATQFTNAVRGLQRELRKVPASK